MVVYPRQSYARLVITVNCNQAPAVAYAHSFCYASTYCAYVNVIGYALSATAHGYITVA
jgi:hypothetical protein